MPKHTITELERIQYRMTGYTEVMKRNMERLNDIYLLVSGMIDVDLTSLSDGDVLQWNATSEKFENVPYTSIFP